MNPPQAMPASIRIFLADGQPEGIRVVDKSNWTGRAVVASRAQLGEALQRGELARAGVYALIGPGDGSDSRVYVGEADDLRERIKKHATAKDFWTRFIAFSSADGSLNKAHVRYLESRLVELAQAANQWEVDNGNMPAWRPLSEADRADAEWFIEEMLVIFPLLSIDVFKATSGQSRERDSVEFAQSLVLNGSGASDCGWLQGRGVLKSDCGDLVFPQDFRFNLPSMAASVLVDGSASGRLVWKNTQGRTLKVLQEERAEEQV
jgi:hypothetical protein